MNDPAAAARQALANGNAEEAVRIARAHADTRPADADAARLHAAIASQAEDAGAEHAWRTVLALLPGDPEAHYMLGNIDGERGDFAAAADHFRAALARAPSHPQLRASLGLAFEELGRSQEAEACFRQALAGFRDPPFGLIGALARNLFRQRRFAEALPHFDALSKRFGIADAALNAAYAACLSAEGRDADADATFRRALDADPSAQDLARDYAAFLMRNGRHADAARLLERSAIGADLLATSMLLICRLQLADWRDIDALRSAVIGHVTEGLVAGNDIVPAYDFLSICDDPLLQRKVAERWARADAPRAAPATAGRRRGGKFRLGFVSSDYSNHPVGRLIVGLFERLDRRRFEVAAYATSAGAGDAFGARVEAAVDRYRVLDRRNVDASANALKADAMDVLFDLNGFSGGEAIRMFAQRPAPVQINFLGYTGTLGVDAYDFIVTDRCCMPPERQDACVERLLYVDPCYLPSDPAREIAAPTRTRPDYALPPGGIVFCAFAAVYKIMPEIFDRWMTLLRDVPGSVLWLRHAPQGRIERLRAAAAARGIDGARLVFAPGEAIDRYLARFALADLFLDSFPFGSHTTVNDALFAGLPVVTIAGQGFASRASASQLHAVGLAELVANDPDGYVDIARSLANDRARCARIRQALAEGRSRSALFDMDAYARAFEAAVTKAYEARAGTR